MKLVTHDGTFHADDVLAHAVLTTVYPDASLTRTRDKSVLAEADIVFDVGAEYSPAKRIFDHHQKDRPARDDGTPYSSVGLIWFHFGLRCLTNIMPAQQLDILARVWDTVDKSLVREIDLVDNGILKPSGTSFASLIEDYNSPWDDREQDGDKRFMMASSMAKGVLDRRISSAWADAKAYESVRDAARSAGDKRIIVLPEQMPWQSAIFQEGFTEALYVVYEKDGTWYCTAVPVEQGSYVNRKPLPEEWAGLRDEDLDAVTGVKGGVFCHPSRFICGARTFDAVMEMARMAAGN